MLVQQTKEDAYFNFVNSINSDVTRKKYEYYVSKFLQYCNLDLDSLLSLTQQEISNLIIRYLVSLKISSQYKAVIFASIKHASAVSASSSTAYSWPCPAVKVPVRGSLPNFFNVCGSFG